MSNERPTDPSPPPDAPITLISIAARLDNLSDIVTAKADQMIQQVERAARLVDASTADAAAMTSAAQSMVTSVNAVVEQAKALGEAFVAHRAYVDEQVAALSGRLGAMESKVNRPLPCDEARARGNGSYDGGCPVEAR